MSVDWDARYRKSSSTTPMEPHALLRSFLNRIPPGNVLDIAMGAGRDSLFLLNCGLNVYGIDRSVEAVRMAHKNAKTQGRQFAAIVSDAKHIPFKPDSFEGVIVFYFLYREILDNVVGLLKKGGILVYETYLLRQNLLDRERNAQFLLEDGEMYQTLRDKLETLFYEETTTLFREKKRAVMQYVGRKA